MGKISKTSRKGKKAWRANISSADIEDYFEKSTKDALSGGSLADVPSDSLFYVDKSVDLPVKRKIEKKREKVLHYESVLQKNAFVKPIPSSIQKKPKRKGIEVQTVEDGTQVEGKGSVDIWGDGGKQNSKPKKVRKPSIIPAVEVEPHGCSFNPPSDCHQDSLALAVADEMQKIYRKELGPDPVPLIVPGEAIDEENMYFLDADDGTDEDDDEPNEDLMETGDNDSEKRPLKTKTITRVVLNRRARRKEQLKAEAKAKSKDKLSKEIDSLPDIMEEIAREDEEKQNKHLRRTVIKQERLTSAPPRLGKFKFVPAPTQVLLSEDITGSIRKLKGCCTLARDRFKSLEKRGMIAPSKKSSRR